MSNIPVAIELGDLLDRTFYIGAARVGQAVARRALGLAMSILIYGPIPYMDQSPQPVFEAETGARRPASDDGRIVARQPLVAHLRVMCVPHLGCATRHTRAAMANLAARNVVLAGDPPITPVPR